MNCWLSSATYRTGSAEYYDNQYKLQMFCLINPGSNNLAGREMANNFHNDGIYYGA